MSKRILVYGATGRTGKLVVEYALQQGYAVTALVRNPDKIIIRSERLTVLKGFPTNIADVRSAMKDSHYVINVLSALSQKDSMSFRKLPPPHVLKTTIQHSITSMKEYGIRRIISLSSIGVGDSYQYAPWYMRFFIRVSNFRIVFADHHAQEQLLQHSGLDWTVVRPVALNNNEQTGELVVSYNEAPSPFKMSRKQLAMFMVDNLESDAYLHKKPILSEK
jgi:putative NADH-flavin reductase